MLLRDVPRPGFDVPGLRVAARKRPTARAPFPRRRARAARRGAVRRRAAGAGRAGAPVVDLTAAICPGDPCQSVSPAASIVYRDDHHLTATFAREAADCRCAAAARRRYLLPRG